MYLTTYLMGEGYEAASPTAGLQHHGEVRGSAVCALSDFELAGPSDTVPGSAYLLTSPFGPECLTSLADDMRRPIGTGPLGIFNATFRTYPPSRKWSFSIAVGTTGQASTPPTSSSSLPPIAERPA